MMLRIWLTEGVGCVGRLYVHPIDPCLDNPDTVMNRRESIRLLGTATAFILSGSGFARSAGAQAFWYRHNLPGASVRSEEHTSELQSLMRISYAVFCLKKKTTIQQNIHTTTRMQ